MNVEIVEFYPLERNESKNLLTGTLRVKLPDLGIHILGIHVSKRKGYYYFSLPGKFADHHETGERIHFPCVCFEDRERQQDLIYAIREKGIAFIEARLTDTGRPLIFPPKPQPVSKPSKPLGQGNAIDLQQKPKEAPLKTAESKVSIPKPEPKATRAPGAISKIAKTEFVDLPKRPAGVKSNSISARR